MNPIRWTGHFLLWCGFLGGVFVAVRNTEIANAKWSTIEWPLYALAIAVGTVGVVILRMTQLQSATHADKLESDIKILEVSIRDLLAHFANLLKSKQQLDVYSIHKLIDAQLMESINNFVEARETLIHTYGLRQYAELMTDFSTAERNINRAWSASADGYVDEVWLSLERANNRLQVVAQHLVEYKQEALGT